MNSVIFSYHNTNRYFNIFRGNNELLRKRFHIENVLKYCEMLFEIQKPNLNKELFLISAEHHDDGRINQFEILGNFDDTKVSHNTLGVDRLHKWIQTNTDENLIIDFAIDILRDVMAYHGIPNLCSDEYTLPYVELVSNVDEIENSFSCVSYLLDEINFDRKGYIKNNPKKDQKYVSDFVFNCFKNGQKFDKMKYCNTYAEYVLFSAVLFINSVNKYEFARKIALKEGYGYDSIFEGFKYVFSKSLTGIMSKESYNILLKNTLF